MFLEKLEVGVYRVNCYVIADKNSMSAAVIDPGADFENIRDIIEDNGFDLKYIILTHAHGDHIGAINYLKDTYNPKIVIHYLEKEILENPDYNFSKQLGMNSVSSNADLMLHDGDTLELGDLKLEIMHTPGHTKGSMCILVNEIMFSGDTLFAGSMGRTDLYSGDSDRMKASLKKLKQLTINYTVLPGHGAATTLEYEKTSNPFMRDEFHDN